MSKYPKATNGENALFYSGAACVIGALGWVSPRVGLLALGGFLIFLALASYFERTESSE